MQAGFPPCPPQLPFPSDSAPSKVVFFHFSPFFSCCSSVSLCCYHAQRAPASEGERESSTTKQLKEIKKRQANPSTHPCPQASTSKGQDLIGNRSWSISSPAICSRWQQRAGSLLPPMSPCCWGTAVLLSPLHPLSLGVFLLLAELKDGRMLLQQDDSCPKPPLSAESPPPASPSGFQPTSKTLCFFPHGERPSSKLQILTPNRFPTQRSRMNPGEQPGRYSPRLRDTLGSGFPYPAALLGMDEWTRCFLGFKPPSKTTLLPPHCKTRHKQHVPPLLLKEKIVFWVKTILGENNSASLKTKQGWGREWMLTRAEHPSQLPPLRHHMPPLHNSPGETLIIALQLKTLLYTHVHMPD
ncbi:uncharacterized protein LOC127059749 [Serinus canaria]|uniref:uncharacterized protein LOC127059749 n=1 Tax=Serinus canaria TaxID=9135 RepID=UPI0021CC97A9|nr:uncharacterized protein LOC127059749 [Serinus canaria]